MERSLVGSFLNTDAAIDQAVHWINPLQWNGTRPAAVSTPRTSVVGLYISESGETIGEVADGRYLKNLKIAIFHKRFKLSRRNLARWFLTPSEVENLNFWQYKMADSRIFTVKPESPARGLTVIAASMHGSLIFESSEAPWPWAWHWIGSWS